MDTTTHGPFTVTTSPTSRPEGRDWGTLHWGFVIAAGESRSTHSGVFSAGMKCKELAEDILHSIALDASLALAGEGDVRTTIEALQDEGLGYEPLAAYDMAVALVELHDFIAELTDDEREALEAIEEN